MSENPNGDERPSKRLKVEVSEQPTDSPISDLAEVPVRDGSSDQVTEKENKVGITAFVTESVSVLRGLVKRRYADFLVNEILPGGEVLHLKSMRAEKGSNNGAEHSDGDGTKKSKGSEGADEEAKAKGSVPEPSSVVDDRTLDGSVETNGDLKKIMAESQITDEDRAKLISNLNETAVTELLALYASIVRHPKSKVKDHPIVRTEFTTDRTLRAHIHQDIRRIFSSRIDSSTTPEGILVLSALPPQSNRPKNSRPSRQSWQERGGEHCHFTLYKENKDTMEAISLLARFLKMNAKELSFAGTKDRRAVTVQRLSARRVDAERLAALNKALRMVAIGDFEYAQQEVGLGDLEGNEFTITLRDCSLGDTDEATASVSEKLKRLRLHLTTAMVNLRTKGFLNYFGLQRFGTFATRSDVVGLKLLKGDFEGACNAILEYPQSALTPSNDNVADDTATPNASTSQVGREDAARARAIHIFHSTNSIKQSLEIMPRRFSAESAVIRHLGKNLKDFFGAILGIQHHLRSMYVHAYQSWVWNRAVSHRWDLYGDRVVEGDLVLVREHRDKEAKEEETIDADGEIVVKAEGENRAKVADEVFERARQLTKTEAESGAYSILDVVLPQPGYDVLYPANKSGEFYKEFMGSEEGGKLDPDNMRRKQREFSLSGAYRKMLARVGGEWSVDVRSYIRDEEHFVETDLEKIRNQCGDSNVGGGPGSPTQNGDRVQSHEAREKVAAILRFQLGTSQYATMALRELSGGGVREYKPEFSGGR